MDSVDIDEIVRPEPDELQVTKPKLVVTFRSAATQQAYDNAKMLGSTTPLELEPSLMDFKYWRIVNNRFPYDMTCRTSHMLLCKREIPDQRDLTSEEHDELDAILTGHVYDTYDGYFVSSPWKRSVPGHFHVHLLDFHSDRGDMRL